MQVEFADIRLKRLVASHDRRETPTESRAVAPSPQRKYLLLDSRVADSVQNAKLALGTVQKHKSNPLFKEDQPWEPRYDNVYANVIYDEQHDLYKCWYSPFVNDPAYANTLPEDRKLGTYMKALRATGEKRRMGVCYATSKDGIHWTKPLMDIRRWDDEQLTNIVDIGPHGSGIMKDLLEEAGELENTLVVVTSDNGMPFPRAKATLYDFGTRMPLAIRWPEKIGSPGRAYNGFIHLSDMAPTFLEAAGLQTPDEMTARSLMDVFAGENTLPRDAAFTAMERHDGCRKGGKGYPCRAIRTRDFLYIRNYEPDRWPSGDPDAANCARAIPFGEVDSSPTKTLLMDNAAKPEYQRFHQLAFGRRPAEELYDLRSDPGQIENVALLSDYAETRQKLGDRLDRYTQETGDPRALGKDAPWDYYPYYGRKKNQDWVVAGRVAVERPREPVDNVWRPLPSSLEKGLLAERVDAWRQKRLWHMLDAEDDYLLSGFESRPGRHPWQGEHVGKWLHAAALAYEQTRDERLLKALQQVVDRLLSAQLPNGYLGTYGDDYTFMALPENESVRRIVDDVAPQRKQGTRKKRAAKPRGGWDTWTLRYNLYGLLTYEKFQRNKRVVDACRRMADLLIKVYGDGDADLTKYGTRQGISATTLVESIVMLYDRTQDPKYLDFAEHIVAMSESNPKLRLMGQMLEKESVVYSGDGKAYQLMANLLGYLGLYRNTGDERWNCRGRAVHRRGSTINFGVTVV